MGNEAETKAFFKNSLRKKFLNSNFPDYEIECKDDSLLILYNFRMDIKERMKMLEIGIKIINFFE